MNNKRESWRTLSEMEDIDLALLQETCKPPPNIDPAPWDLGIRDQGRTAIARLSDRVSVDWLEPKPLASTRTQCEEFAVSTPGTLSAAIIRPVSGDPFVVISMYAAWERPHPTTSNGWIYADASAHRIVSDLSAFIGQQQGNRVLAAGDLNILRGYGEGGSRYWCARYDTLFARLDAVGLPCVGPEIPNGRQTEPWPDELPADSKTVPTFHSAQQSPATASRQLDFVFASDELADRLNVRAINEPQDWGPSDHCQIEIELLFSE